MTPEEKKATIERIRNRFANNPELLEILARVLFDDGIIDFASPDNFKVWRTIKLGTGLKTVADFLKAIKKTNCRINENAAYILKQPEFTVANKEIEIDLVRVCLSDLFLKIEEPTLEEIYDRAKMFGLEKCPPEVGPQLIVQYPDQSDREHLTIVMDYITSINGIKEVFRIIHNQYVYMLHGGYGGYDPEEFCLGGVHYWVFVRPRPTK